MHDLARTRLEPGAAVGDVGEGVRWQDEQVVIIIKIIITVIVIFIIIHVIHSHCHPGDQARMAGRTTSTASLHMLGAGMPHGSEVICLDFPINH